MDNRFTGLSYLIYIIIIIIVLSGLNVDKFLIGKERVMEVWTGEDREYYNIEGENFSSGLISLVNPDNLIYRLTRIRLRAPITYLKREIPLLGYYTPEKLKSPADRVYEPGQGEGTARVIQLSFDLQQSEDREEEGPETRENKKGSRERPAVVLYHTHTSETYVDDPRNQDDNGHVMPGNIGNVARVGMELANILSEKYNFRVIHSTKIHDENYVRAYYNSRQTVKNILQQQAGIDMVFDIHRDGVEYRARKAYTTAINGTKMARIMIVVTNGRFEFAHLNMQEQHREWQRNLNFARKLAGKMEEMYPGLLKEIEIRDTIYNQDLHPNSLVLEIGDYQNTTGEALRSVRLLAEVIAALNLS